MPGTQAHRVTGTGDVGIRAFAPILYVTHFDYDFSVTGDPDTAKTISRYPVPAGANVIGGWYKVLTTFTSSSDASTPSLQLVGANDLVTAIAISDASNPWDVDLTKDRPLKAIATQLVAEKYVQILRAAEAVTAGKLVGAVYWVLPEIVSSGH